MTFRESRPPQILAEPTMIRDGTIALLGRRITLERLPPAAVSVELLTNDGTYAALSEEGGICGIFSLAAETTPVRPLTMADVFMESEDYMSAADKAMVLRMFQEEYRYWKTLPGFVESGLRLDQLSLKEQAIFFYTVQADPYFHGLEPYLGPEKIQSLRAVLLSIGYTGNAKLAERILKKVPIDELMRYCDQAPQRAQSVHAQLVQQFGEQLITVADVTRGFIAGAFQALAETETTDYAQVLRQSETEVAVLLTFFREIIHLPEQDTKIDLTQVLRRHGALLQLVEHNPTLHGLFVDLLLLSGKLKPSPELFWREDRPMAEYNERTGINVINLARALAHGSESQEILFEPGAGAGVGIAQRNAELNGLYHDFALNDYVYYPLRKLLAKCINFEALNLPPKEQEMFADYLYKVLYLQAGAMEAITRNPNSLKQLLRDLGPKLQQAAAVPSEYGVQPQADGTKTYPNKIQWREQSEAFQAAYQAFQMHPERYVHQTVLAGDLKEQIPIFPVGM